MNENTYIKKITIMIVLINFFWLFGYEKVEAEDEVSLQDYINSGTGSGYVSSTWDEGMYCDGNWYTIRITLVDESGNKVAGTKSVDYRYVNNSNTTVEEDWVINERKRLSPVNGKYYYKYGENSINEYSAYKVKLTNENHQNDSCSTFFYNYGNFTRDLRKTVNDRTDKRFNIKSGSTEKFDFFTMFLYHSGFLDENEGYFDIDDAHWKHKKAFLANTDEQGNEQSNGQDKKYYLLIEPTFWIFGKYNVYGTSKELAAYLYSTGTVPIGLTKAASCALTKGMYVNSDEILGTGFSRITQPNDIAIMDRFCYAELTTPTNAEIRELWKNMVDDSYGYGYGTGMVSIEAIMPTEKKANYEIEMNTKYCDDYGYTGQINFELKDKKTSEKLVENEFDISKSAGYNFKRINSENSEIYCYDDVNYDFSNTVNELNNKIFIPGTYASIKKGKITVNRHCRVLKSQPINIDTEKAFMNDFSDYENQKIELKVPFQKESIFLTKSNVEYDEKFVKTKNLIPIVYNISFSAEFEYKNNNNSNVYIPNDYNDNTAYINFENVTFGYSNEIVEQIKKKQIIDNGAYSETIRNINTSLISHIKASTGNMKCPLTTKIEPKTDPSVIQFRTIDLNNPFPARDGSSRLPGSNWLGKDNYVRTYINHNRGELGNDVYNKEPIYVITLTPSTMTKIREYNKKHNYSDIKLVCKGENDTECFSEFLGEIDSKNISGTCYDVTANNLIKDPLKFKDNDLIQVWNKIVDVANTGNPFGYSYTSEDLKYDFNKDGILTLRDSYIYDNAEKTTNYYTCADKTYENSGYIRKEQ